MKKFVLAALTLSLMLGAVTAQDTKVQSQNSTDLAKPGLVPGDVFYPVEQFVEKIEVGIAKSPVIGSAELEAKVRANNAEERLSEARKLSERNRTDAAERLMAEYKTNMNIAAKNARDSNNTVLSEQLENVTRKHENVLRDVQRKVPEPAKKAIQNAIDNNNQNFPARKPNKPGVIPGDENRNRSGKIPTPEPNIRDGLKTNSSENTSLSKNVTEPKETLNETAETEDLRETGDVKENVNQNEKKAEELTGDFSERSSGNSVFE